MSVPRILLRTTTTCDWIGITAVAGTRPAFQYILAKVFKLYSLPLWSLDNASYHQFNWVPYNELSPEERLTVPANNLQWSTRLSSPSENESVFFFSKINFHEGKIQSHNFCVKHDILSFFFKKKYLVKVQLDQLLLVKIF